MSGDVIMQVTPPNDRLPFPNFAKPAEVGHFSRDHEDRLHWDKSQLASYSAPNSISSQNLDLNDGCEHWIEQRQRLPGCLDNLLRWIYEDRRHRSTNCGGENSKFNLKDLVHGADVVCWRGLFTKLAASPYEQRENWLLGVVRFRNVLFLVMFETEAEKVRNANLSEKDKRMIYWGHRFERYVVAKSSAPNSKTTTVDCNEQFCVVYRTKLAPAQADASTRQFRLLYGAEIDCVDEFDRYIELKTSRVIDGWRQERNFKRFKLLKWWLQSFFAGIDRIVCGHRDDAGVVKYLQNYDVPEMPKSATAGVGENLPWSGAGCINFLYELLNFVDKHAAYPSHPATCSEITVFEFDPRSRLVRLVRNHGFTSDQVIPDWFVAAFGNV